MFEYDQAMPNMRTATREFGEGGKKRAKGPLWLRIIQIQLRLPLALSQVYRALQSKLD